MKRIICLMMVAVFAISVLGACEKKPPKAEDIDMSKIENLDSVSESSSETDYVIIDVKDFGKIVARLYPDVAPETVKNFKSLVSRNFYDGLTFHRVVKEFMIQGGDPKGDGTGDSGTTIKGEFYTNGFENNLKHTRGVLSMARGNENDSASCQFFICHKSNTRTASLNGKYATFGYVVYGLDVLDAIASVKTVANESGTEKSKPKETITINSIRFATVSE